MHRALADLADLAVLADLVAEEAAGLRDGPVARAAYRPLL